MLKIGEFSQLTQISVRMLRHYALLGLLKPEFVDRETGYRYYSVDQLPRLHRLLSLRDLGLSLEEIAAFIDQEISAESLRHMLQIKRAELKQTLEQTTLRLQRIEQHLAGIDATQSAPPLNVVVKKLPETRALACYQTLPPLTTAEFGGLFYEGNQALLDAGVAYQRVLALSYNIYPAYPRQYTAEYPYRFEVVFTLNTRQSVPDVPFGGRVLSCKDIPGVEQAACVVHEGSDVERLRNAHYGVIHWMDRHGYALDGPVRDVFLRRGTPDNPDCHLTEVQYPIRKVNASPNRA